MRSRPVLLVVLALLWAPTGLALDGASLEKRIGSLIAKSGVQGTLGIHVVRLSDGAELYRRDSTTSLNPASNLKLLTAAAVLRRLGPEYRMWTGFYGDVRQGQVNDLVVRGYGDPTLQLADLIAVAEDLRARGVKRVRRIVIDGSFFDQTILPPAFDQQPKEAASFRAAISAIAVDRNAYVLRVGSGGAVGAPAVASVWADNYIQLDNRLKTSASGSPRVRADQVATKDRRLALTVRGSIPRRLRRLEYRRRVEDPLSYAGHVIVKVLKGAGIGGAQSITYGAGPEGLPLIVAKRSEPVSKMLYSVGKWSDNFAAEMLVKVLGAESGRPGNSEKGVRVVLEELTKLGVSMEGLTVVNGSGLFRGNQVAPAHLTQVLRAMYEDDTLSSEYVAHLAIAGTDGTLRKRLKDLPVPRMVRAKTGTLSDVIALSGYVFGATPEEHLAFSLLFNGVQGRQRDARNLADDIVRALAGAVTAAK